MNRESFPDPSPLRPAIPRCARRSLWFGSIRRTELTIPSSHLFAMYTRESFRSSTLRISKMFNQPQRQALRKFQAPNPRLQPNFKPQTQKPSNIQSLKCAIRGNLNFELWRFVWNLGFGAWDFRRRWVWDLDLGASRAVFSFRNGTLARVAVLGHGATFGFAREP